MKYDLLRFRCSSGHVLSKTKSVTPHFFYISDITNSLSFDGKMFRKKSMLEKFRANVLKWVICVARKILSREMKDYNKFTHISNTVDMHFVCRDFG